MIRTHLVKALYRDLLGPKFGYDETLEQPFATYQVGVLTSCFHSEKIDDKIINECLQLLGGYGYMEDYPLARMFRDSRLGPIGGGTSEILREIIAKILIDKKTYKPKGLKDS